jgi:alkylation response protein AidB-like acyl-CoA dehydrogenase
MVKAWVGDKYSYAGDRAVQFHGGIGFTYECNAQIFLRRAQFGQSQFGDAPHHRKLLAKLLLD